MKTLLITVLGILLTAGVVQVTTKWLFATKTEAEKRDTPRKPVLVEVEVLKRGDVNLVIESEGVVETQRDSILSAEVGGRVVEIHPDFEEGAQFKEGQVVAKIDALNYEAAVVQARATLADAKVLLVQEEARAKQAARDWKKIGGGKEPSDLVLRKPFLESARARIDSARAGLERAMEDLNRTVIRAPFDCRVREATLNLGAMVGAGTRLGVIYDAESLVIKLPFPLDDFAQVSKDSEVELSAGLRGRQLKWKGEVLWELGEVDPQTLASSLLVKIVPNHDEGRFRLPFPGQFLNAQVRGAKVEGVIGVPRNAIRGQNQVMVLNGEGELEMRKVRVIEKTKDRIYVGEGVSEGEKLILTRLDVPVAGMKLEEVGEEQGGDESKGE